MLTATTNFPTQRRIVFDEHPIGKGAEKVVFFSQDRREVICFFKNQLKNRSERLQRLSKILGHFNPTAEGRHAASYWAQHFCWPTGVIDGDSQIPATFLAKHGLLAPALAVITPAYRDNFFFTNTKNKRVEGDVSWFVKEKTRAWVPAANRGNFLSYLKILTKLARAVRRMHQAGLAHSDLSNRNVLIDPKSGDCCIIDIDSLVVPHFAPPIVKGTHGYIAPEVVMEQVMPDGKLALPCIETDLYALGVLMYECLLFRHPIERDKPVDYTLPSEQDNILAYGSKALFREHPTDFANRPKVPPVVRVEHLGPYLAELMLRLFVDGIHNRSKRPKAGEWEEALYRTADLLHPAHDGTLNPSAGDDFFVLAPKMAMEVPKSREKLTKPVPYARMYVQGKGGMLPEARPRQYVKFHSSLTVWNQRPLYDWQTRTGAAPNENVTSTSPVGIFQFFKGKWYLTSNADYEMKTGDGKTIKRGESVLLTPNLRLYVHPSPQGRIFQFDFMNP
jgi:hypothetical protein